MDALNPHNGFLRFVFLLSFFTVLWDSKKWVVWFSVDGFKLSDDDNPAFHCSFCPPHDLQMDTL
jgi:hypothetical protein